MSENHQKFEDLELDLNPNEETIRKHRKKEKEKPAKKYQTIKIILSVVIALMNLFVLLSIYLDSKTKENFLIESEKRRHELNILKQQNKILEDQIKTKEKELLNELIKTILEEQQDGKEINVEATLLDLKNKKISISNSQADEIIKALSQKKIIIAKETLTFLENKKLTTLDKEEIEREINEMKRKNQEYENEIKIKEKQIKDAYRNQNNAIGMTVAAFFSLALSFTPLAVLVIPFWVLAALYAIYNIHEKEKIYEGTGAGRLEDFEKIRKNEIEQLKKQIELNNKRINELGNFKFINFNKIKNN